MVVTLVGVVSTLYGESRTFGIDNACVLLSYANSSWQSNEDCLDFQCGSVPCEEMRLDSNGSAGRMFGCWFGSVRQCATLTRLSYPINKQQKLRALKQLCY